MLYCEYCMKLMDCPNCPDCKKRNLRPPRGNDPVYLMSKAALWSGGIEEILKENDIPCLKQGSKGSFFNVILGSFTERYNYFVPYGALEKSRELLADFFEEDREDGEEQEPTPDWED